MRFIPAVSGVQISVPPPIANMTHRVIGAFFVLLQELKNFAVFEKKVLTNAPSSCNIIQVAARHRLKREYRSLIGSALLEQMTQTKKKNKKFLTVWKRCGIINESLEAKLFKRKRASKDRVVLWKLNNATWIICDSSQMFLKTSIDYEHKQSAISLLSFIFWRLDQKIIRANQGSS